MAKRRPVNMTMDKEVVEAIDEAIKGTSYRSRSHAIEDVMRRWAEQQIRERADKH